MSDWGEARRTQDAARQVEREAAYWQHYREVHTRWLSCDCARLPIGYWRPCCALSTIWRRAN